MIENYQHWQDEWYGRMLYYRVRGYPPPYVCGPVPARGREERKRACKTAKSPRLHQPQPTPRHAAPAPAPHRTVSCPISFTPSRPVTVTQPHGTSHSPAQRISTTSPCTGSRPVTIFTINGPGFACARTHARNRKKAPVVSRRAADADRQEPEPTPRRARKPNQTKPNRA